MNCDWRAASLGEQQWTRHDLRTYAFDHSIPQPVLNAAAATPMRPDAPLLVRDVLDLFYFYAAQSKAAIGGFIVRLLSASVDAVGEEAHTVANSAEKVHKLHENSGKKRTLTFVREAICKTNGLGSDAFTRFCAMPFLPVAGWRAHQDADLTAEEKASGKKRKSLGTRARVTTGTSA